MKPSIPLSFSCVSASSPGASFSGQTASHPCQREVTSVRSYRHASALNGFITTKGRVHAHMCVCVCGGGGGGHFLHMHTCVCMCACVCACMHAISVHMCVCAFTHSHKEGVVQESSFCFNLCISVTALISLFPTQQHPEVLRTPPPPPHQHTHTVTSFLPNLQTTLADLFTQFLTYTCQQLTESKCTHT